MAAVDNMCPDTKAAVIGWAPEDGYTGPLQGFWDMPDPSRRGPNEGLVEMGGDRHHGAHWGIIFRSRQTILFEQADARLLGNAPALGSKVIPH